MLGNTECHIKSRHTYILILYFVFRGRKTVSWGKWLSNLTEIKGMDVLTKLKLMVYNVTEVESNVTSDKTAVIYENGDNPVWSEKDK